MSCTVCMYVHTTVHVPGKTKTCTRYVPHVCTIKRFTCRSNMGMSNLHMCTCMYCTPLMTCTCTCTSTSTSTRYSTCHQVFEEATKPTKKRASTAQSESRLRTVLAPIHCTKSRNGKKESKCAPQCSCTVSKQSTICVNELQFFWFKLH